MSITRGLVQSLSGFGPTYDDLIMDPDAFRNQYGCHTYMDVTFCSKQYLLRFDVDYDMPGCVYLSRITSISTGHSWFASSVSSDPFGKTYPISWSYV